MQQCIEALTEGKVILYPTETVYGLGADATNREAVEKIFRIKNRNKSKPISVALASVEDAKEIAYFNKFADVLAEKFMPGPLTLVLKSKVRIPLITFKGKIGIRIPDNKFIQILLQEFRRPITATSANISGFKSATNVGEIDKKLLKFVEIIVEGQAANFKKESTVVEITGSKPKILREGAVSKEMMEGVEGMHNF